MTSHELARLLLAGPDQDVYTQNFCGDNGHQLYPVNHPPVFDVGRCACQGAFDTKKRTVITNNEYTKETIDKEAAEGRLPMISGPTPPRNDDDDRNRDDDDSQIVSWVDEDGVFVKYTFPDYDTARREGVWLLMAHPAAEKPNAKVIRNTFNNGAVTFAVEYNTVSQQFGYQSDFATQDEAQEYADKANKTWADAHEAQK